MSPLECHDPNQILTQKFRRGFAWYRGLGKWAAAINLTGSMCLRAVTVLHARQTAFVLTQVEHACNMRYEQS